MSWSASQYVQFEEDRTRPVRDLLAAIPPVHATSIVDLGCGPGNSTELLCARYPDAKALGLDSSPDMLQAARRRLPTVTFAETDIAHWTPEQPADVILANAVLHWVPGHEALFGRLMSNLSKGGSLAVQMPDNMQEPSQRAMDKTASDPAWAGKIAAAAGFRAQMDDADGYIRMLRPLATRLDVWRTTYMHILPGGPAAIVEWFKGSGLRPFLAALDDGERERFLGRYQSEIETAYPALPDGSVVLRFPRLFIVATR